MIARQPRRIVLPEFGAASMGAAASVLDSSGRVVASVAEPAKPPDVETLRNAVIVNVLDKDFGAVVLAGVAFASRWGGDAVGFT